MVDEIEERQPESNDPPLLLQISCDVIPGNDPDVKDMLLEALEAAYEDMRNAILFPNRGETSSVVREFFKRNRGRALRATVAVLVIESDE